MFVTPKSLLIGITGGIAAYKICDIVRHFIKLGVSVQTVMTENACRFITPTTLEALTGRPCFTGMFDSKNQTNGDGAFRHIDLGRDFDVFLVAPATANVLAKMANGIADDLLSTTYLCFDGQVVVAPAMNTRMWNHAATTRNLEILKKDGIDIVQPSEGLLACGESGTGRMADTEIISARIEKLLGANGPWKNKRVLVTTGATRESFDPVRFVSNNSTGELGRAIGRQLIRYGAETTMIEANPQQPNCSQYSEYVAVTTADEMLAAVIQKSSCCDYLFMMSAVADYRPALNASSKIKKTEGDDELAIELVRTKDVLCELSAASTSPILVGVSAETDNVIDNSWKKLERKNLDAIIAVDVGGDNRPFGPAKLTASILFKDRTTVELSSAGKDTVAITLLNELQKRR